MPRWRDATTLATVFAVYVVTAKLGLTLASVHANATPVWPPTGIALAALLVFGRRLWPAIALGAFVATVTTAGSVATSLAIATGNTLEAVIGAALVERFAGGLRAFDRPRDTFKFAALAALLSPAISATIGVASLALAGSADWANVPIIWLTWWLGDCAGALIVAPPLILWRADHSLRRLRPRLPEAGLWLVCVVVASVVVFTPVARLAREHHPLAFLTLPGMIWAAFRFGPREATTALLLVAGFAVWGTAQGAGPFGSEPPNVAMLTLQAFLATVGAMTLVTAAVVAERRRATDAVRASEQRIRRLADTVPAMLWMAGPDGGHMFVNRALLDFTGRTLEQEVGSGWIEGIHPEDLADYLRRRGTAVSARAAFEIEYRLRRHDGSYRWVFDRGAARFGPDGTFQGYAGICVEIHDRKRAEQRLRARHAVSRVLAEAGSVADAVPRILQSMGETLGWEVGAVWWVAPEGDVMRCHHVWQAAGVEAPGFIEVTRAAAFARGTGLPGRVWSTARTAWVTDVTIDDNFPRASAATRDGLHGAFAFPVLVADQCTGAVEFFSRSLQPPDDELLEIVASAGSQLGQFAERMRAHAAIQVAEEQRSELLARAERARAEAEQRRHEAETLAEVAATVTEALSPEVVAQRIADSVRMLLAADPAALFRLEPSSGNMVLLAMSGETARAPDRRVVLPPGAGIVGLAARERTAVTSTDFLDDERILVPDTLRARVEPASHRAALAVPLIVQGRVIGALFAGDHPGRRFTEADVRLAKAFADQAAIALRNAELFHDAEQASRAKDEFLAMLGHELRNPLSAITTAASLLDRGGALAPSRAREIIARQARHLTELVNDLLDVARVTTGKIALVLQPLDLGEAARNTMATLAAAGRTARHAVTVDVAPAWVHADETRIEQVITNLVLNAVKYTPENGRIRVEVRPEGNRARLVVEDSGHGIAEDVLPRIFDLFVQGEQAPDRAQGGLGIGLTLVRRLAELHGGTVHAQSAGPGRGSAFTVRLPRIGPPAPAAAARAAHGGVAARRVLVVEDNTDGREMLAHALTLAGHEVHVAEDGPTGVAQALRVRPDVALVDLGLPGFDGYEVARRIRDSATGKSVRLIAVTGYGREADRRRATEAGFDVYLIKPVDPDRLHAALDTGAC
jgi:PAS domain S-box-containing protein